ncbi:MAG: hypothetical protein DF168_01341 [Candidatus Moanabacter tarae]|uniref:Phytanoyl-CoA dioxygenase n=1 Tax=Candidatus Moanibacter tarae TaxID=2200854 RepID=A0A2Z4AM42_9BACT|nr:MAG: hypothetical protein DF168_01341 [Candidatus Moanabacter tarae]|tara:strand:- start:18856 stop:19662 length:807 start_codon:yes stop_codon:yes gene_type:complete
MARFAALGVLRFDKLVPADLNTAAHEEMAESNPQRLAAGTPLSECFPAPSAIGEIIRLPQIQGIIESLVGPGCEYDHHSIHTREPRQVIAQSIHGDAIIDTRMHFDIQLLYFPHDVPPEMGGTMLIPGSHFRRINCSDIARYQNFLGQEKMHGKAGTVFALHHGIWHGGGRNETNRIRYMFKLRLNPKVRQKRLWDVSDIDQQNSGGEKIRSEIKRILGKKESWFEFADGQLEIVNRIKFWRFLTGDETFDTGYWLTRIENMPESVAG